MEDEYTSADDEEAEDDGDDLGGAGFKALVENDGGDKGAECEHLGRRMRLKVEGRWWTYDVVRGSDHCGVEHCKCDVQVVDFGEERDDHEA